MKLLEMVCKGLGVEVEEEWLANNGYVYKITSDGRLFVKDFEWLDVNEWANIISGELKPAWRPKEGEVYYTPIFNDAVMFKPYKWEGNFADMQLFKRHLVFKKPQKAVAIAFKMLEALKED